MARATSLPVTVKNRIGIRSRKTGLSLESYEHLRDFVKTVSGAGCRKFTVHARIAILEGLSPRENRDVPPLRPEDVYGLKEEFPELFIEINGGYKTPEQIDAALNRTDAVMLGRVALDNPWMLSRADRRWFGSPDPVPTRGEVLEAALPYLIHRAESGASRGLLIQPLMNLFAGESGARAWKRAMTAVPPAGIEGFGPALEKAVENLNPSLLDS
jgi:tRNA-dihydrouridine synthase A